MINFAELNDKITAVADIVSICVGKIEDKSTWRVHYKEKPSAEQLAQVAAIIKGQKVLTLEEEQAQNQALSYLQATDWQIVRHLEEVGVGADTTLTSEEFKALAVKRAASRAVTKE